MAQQPDAPDPHEHTDHCVCDIELHEDEVTSDADLPVAAGGVAAAGGPQADDDDVDGCDEDFNKFEPTSDEDLPVAIGGVA
jgi:hypothetical protein